MEVYSVYRKHRTISVDLVCAQEVVVPVDWMDFVVLAVAAVLTLFPYWQHLRNTYTQITWAAPVREIINFHDEFYLYTLRFRPIAVAIQLPSISCIRNRHMWVLSSIAPFCKIQRKKIFTIPFTEVKWVRAQLIDLLTSLVIQCWGNTFDC